VPVSGGYPDSANRPHRREAGPGDQEAHPSTDAAIYFYSKYERTIYRRLQAKYPEVCDAEDIERLFDPARAIDLYGDVVLTGDGMADPRPLDQDARQVSWVLLARRATAVGHRRLHGVLVGMHPSTNRQPLFLRSYVRAGGAFAAVL